jgi:DNA-binding CsgD family transcriptional regulator
VTQPRILTTDEALGSGDRLLELKAHTLAALVGLVPASVAVFTSLSKRLAIENAVGLLAPGSERSLQDLWRRYLDDLHACDPLAPHALDSSSATVLALEQLEERAPRFVALLQEDGFWDCVTVYLRVNGTIVAAIGLVRALDRPRFQRSDVLSLRRIQPLVELAFARAVDPGNVAAAEMLRGSGLTAREADVAELVGRGATNAEISRTLHVSEATVKTHLTRIYTKVGVQSRTQLAILVGGAHVMPLAGS